MDRLRNLERQISSEIPENVKLKNRQYNDNTCFIVDSIRSPITKAYKGGLKDYSPEIILSEVLKSLIERNSFLQQNLNEINDIIIGNALQQGSGFISGRASQIISNLPNSVPLYTVNRLCNSGLQAIINANNSIECGNEDIIIAGGIESMTFNNFNKMLDKDQLGNDIKNEYKIDIQNLLTPMGITNENICKKYNITREEQDLFAYQSHKKAFKSQEIDKFFDNEIVKVKNCFKDDCIRKNINIDSMKKLKPVFTKDGTTTAGNSSPLSDGCALSLLMSYKAIKHFKIKNVLGKINSYVSVGVQPELMGIGPSIAIPLLLQKNNLSIDDIDIFEINEAFAGQCLYCKNKLKIPDNKFNLLGGAVAIGHPLGCTGARLITTILNQLKIFNKKLGVVSMCVGTGMGCAALIERINEI